MPGAAAILFGLCLPVAASAASWPPDGAAIATHGIPPAMPSCASCHGDDFAGKAAIGAPSLRGRSAADLMDRLYDIAGNAKDHSKMAWVARHLTMSQRAAVTAYIAHLPPKPE